MTPRERRLLRLIQLRERQHDVAALHLRAARSGFAAAQSALDDARAGTRAAQTAQAKALEESDLGERLIASADVEAGMLIAANHSARVARVATTVGQAAEAEAMARRERRQMEVTLELVQGEYAERSLRVEQATLDEIAQMQRARSGAHAPWRRGL